MAIFSIRPSTGVADTSDSLALRDKEVAALLLPVPVVEHREPVASHVLGRGPEKVEVGGLTMASSNPTACQSNNPLRGRGL